MFNKETFKSILIIGLFVLSIVLTGNIFYKVETYSKTNIPVEDPWTEHTYDINQFFNPQGYYVNFGGGLYSVIYEEDRYDHLNENVITFLKNSLDQTLIKESSAEQWLEAKKSKGIGLTLPYEMELYQLISLVNNSDISFDADYSVKELMISRDNTIYINGSDGYYKINFFNSFGPLETVINDLESSSRLVEYKRIENIYSLSNIVEKNSFQENNVLIPINRIEQTPILRAEKEIIIDENNEINANEYANKIFGSSFNFVRKIVDYDGSVVYMYGYGEKALKVSLDGALQYEEKINQSSDDETYSFKEGMEKSINVLNTVKELPEDLYLSNYYTYEKENHLIRRYEFNYKINNYDVIIDKNKASSMVVELYGNQVVFFNRNIRFPSDEINLSGLYDDPISINHIINKNYNIIVNDYVATLAEEDKKEKIQDYIYEILQNIKSARVVYLLDAKDVSERLMPVWEIKIKSNTYYFNIYTGYIESKVIGESSNELE